MSRRRGPHLAPIQPRTAMGVRSCARALLPAAGLWLATACSLPARCTLAAQSFHWVPGAFQCGVADDVFVSDDDGVLADQAWGCAVWAFTHDLPFVITGITGFSEEQVREVALISDGTTISYSDRWSQVCDAIRYDCHAVVEDPRAPGACESNCPFDVPPPSSQWIVCVDEDTTATTGDTSDTTAGR